MRAVVYDAFGQPPRVQEVTDPETPADGVVVRVRATGLCRSDWHGWAGHDPLIQLPHVPGHELAGEVTRVGSQVSRWQVGDRVTVPFCIGCGQCCYCQRGQQQICDQQYQPGFSGWGSFAELVALPHADENLVRLPEDIGFAEGATLGCRFVTAFRAIVQQGQIEAGQWLAVFGCGGVGLSAVMIGAARGAQVIAIDTQPAALQYAERFGARHLVRWESARQVGEAIRTITPGGVQVSLDALGDADVIAASIRCLRKQGLHMQVGLLGGSLKEKTVPVDRIVALELRLAGSHGMAVDGYHQILADMAAGAYRPADLVARRVGLSEAARLLPKIPASDLAGVTIIEPDRP